MKSALSCEGDAKSGAVTIFDPDLEMIIDAWDILPEAIKAGILAMVKASR
jgi:hypothetical protein